MKKNIRLILILDKLSNLKKVCIKSLAIDFNLTVRTIESDFELLKDYFDEKLIKKGDCYFLLKKEYFYDLFSNHFNTSKQFLKFLSIVDTKLFNLFRKEHKEVFQVLKLDSSSIYKIENSPYEKLKSESLEIIEKIEDAIRDRAYITIIHHKPKYDIYIYRMSQPLKIFYLKDNWYLAVNTTQDYHNNSCFRLLRISFIEKISRSISEPKTFQDINPIKLKSQQNLHKIQTPFSKIDITPYRVVVKVSASVSSYFKMKQYLNSQRVIGMLDNGDIMVEFMITHDMEVLPIIQQWIPHLQVIEPIRIQNQITENIQLFMNLK